MSAREFLTFDMSAHPEWRGKTLFIDGLDEVRADTSDVSTPFDAIRERLDRLKKPRARLSCKRADWIRNNDLTKLRSVSKLQCHVVALRPLTNSDVPHLARLIRGRLPARRVTPRLTGAGWNHGHGDARALCRKARSALIERGPVGVGLYGDVSGFSHEKKCVLLDSPNCESNRLYSEGFIWKTATTFGAFVTPDMEPVLKEILSHCSREEKDPLFADFGLNVLCWGMSLADLAGVLLEIVYDKTRWPRVRTSVLDAFIHHCPDSPKKIGRLEGFTILIVKVV